MRKLPAYRHFRTRRWISGVYAAGAALTVALLLASLLQAQPGQAGGGPAPGGLGEALSGARLIRMEPASLTALAVVVVLLATVVGLLGALLTYLSVRRWRAAGLSAATLALLALAFALAFMLPSPPR